MIEKVPYVPQYHVELSQPEESNFAGKPITTIHDLRKVARARSIDWWARVFDEIIMGQNL